MTKDNDAMVANEQSLELEPCPKCGALPCDWVDNPHTRAALPTPDGQIVEAVARAIHEADPDVGVSWNDWVAYAEAHLGHMQSVEFVRRQARAALAALPAAQGEGEELKPSRQTLECIRTFNEQVRAGTAEVDPREDHNHPCHDIVCGWCGEIHIDGCNPALDQSALVAEQATLSVIGGYLNKIRMTAAFQRCLDPRADVDEAMANIIGLCIEAGAILTRAKQIGERG